MYTYYPLSKAYPVFVLWFAFSIIHRSRKAAKNGGELGTLLYVHKYSKLSGECLRSRTGYV